MLKRIPLELVYPNPDQPRKLFDERKLAELATSIQLSGLKQPITVRPDGEGKYMIVMGERRYRAHKLLQKRGDADTILAHVRKMDDQELMVDAIIENMQRADITPLEEANAFARLQAQTGWDDMQTARQLGISQHWRVTDRLSLLKLEPEHQTLLASGSITANAAYEVAKLGSADQTRIIKRIANGDLRGDTAVKAAVSVVLDNLSQEDIFGDAGIVSEEDVATLNRMEKKIAQVEALLAHGWRDGECVAAAKVSPDRAELMADKIATMMKSLKVMEKALRMTQAQVEMVMEKAA